MCNEVDNAVLLRNKASGLDFKGQMVVSTLPIKQEDGVKIPQAAATAAAAAAGCPFAAALTAGGAPPSQAPAAAAAAGDGAAAQGDKVLLFLSSPRLANLDDLHKHKIFLSGAPQAWFHPLRKTVQSVHFAPGADFPGSLQPHAVARQCCPGGDVQAPIALRVPPRHN